MAGIPCLGRPGREVCLWLSVFLPGQAPHRHHRPLGGDQGPGPDQVVVDEVPRSQRRHSHGRWPGCSRRRCETRWMGESPRFPKPTAYTCCPYRRRRSALLLLRRVPESCRRPDRDRRPRHFRLRLGSPEPTHQRSTVRVGTGHRRASTRTDTLRPCWRNGGWSTNTL